MQRRFHLVDVFGSRPMTGNPLAVVVDSTGLSTEDMLGITRWLNFSETTFLFPPESKGADYLVRIFTLVGELPFAGHPTLGTFHVWSGVSGIGREDIVQECGAGLVHLRRLDDTLAFEAPPLIRDGPVDADELAGLAEVLGVDLDEIEDARWCDNGPGWVGILMADAEAVLALKPDFSRYRGSDLLDIGVVGFYPEGSDTLYEVRAFFSNPRGEMVEDPVTGSWNASAAQWMIDTGRVIPPYKTGQGSIVGRDGQVNISGSADSVWVGGHVFDIVEGTISV